MSRHPGVTAETRKIRRDHCWGIRQGWRKIGEEQGLSDLKEKWKKQDGALIRKREEEQCRIRKGW